MLRRSLSCLHTAMNSSCDTHLVSLVMVLPLKGEFGFCDFGDDKDDGDGKVDGLWSFVFCLLVTHT